MGLHILNATSDANSQYSWEWASVTVTLKWQEQHTSFLFVQKVVLRLQQAVLLKGGISKG